MADQNLNLLRLLGRVLTFLGVAWFGIIVLAGIGLLEEFGMSGDFLAGIGGSIIPALLLLAVGRGLRRRAKSMEETPVVVATPTVPTVPEKRVATSRPETSTTDLTPPRLPGSVLPPERPSGRPVPRQVEPLPPPSTVPSRSLEDVISPAEKSPSEVGSPAPSPRPLTRVQPVPAKTSRELVEEARKKWGARTSGPSHK